MRKVLITAALALVALGALAAGGWVWADQSAKQVIEKVFADQQKSGAKLSSYESVAVDPLGNRVEIAGIRYESDAPQPTRLEVGKLTAEGFQSAPNGVIRADRLLLEGVSGAVGSASYRAERFELAGFEGSGAALLEGAAAIGSAGFPDGLAAWRSFSAETIRVPELELTLTFGEVTGRYVYRDLVLSGVERGRMTAFSSAGAAVKLEGPMPEAQGAFSTGPIAIRGLDLSVAERAYLTKAGLEAPFETLYESATVENVRGSMAEGGSVSIRRVTGEGVALRPGPTPFSEFVALFQKAGSSGESLGETEQQAVLTAVSELVGRYRLGRMEAEGFIVRPPGDAGEASIARLSIRDFSAGRVGVVEVEGVEGAGGESRFKLARFALHGLSFGGLFEALGTIGRDPKAEPDPAVIQKLVPTIDRFSIGAVEVTLPGGERGSLEGIDVAYGPRVNGVPTAIATRMSHLVIPVLPDWGEGAKLLAAWGYSALDFGYGMDVSWQESGEYEVGELTLSAEGMGSVALKGRASGVGPQAFSADIAAAFEAIGSAKLESLSLRVANAGLFERVLEQMAENEGVSLDEMRTLLRQQAAIAAQLLGDDRIASEASAALRRFVSEPRSLAVEARPKAPLPLMDLFSAIESDPTSLIEALNLSIRVNE